MKTKVILWIISFFFFSQVIAQKDPKLKLKINALEKIMLGGTNQWIQIQGESAENPILLFLHGGPGFTHMPYSHYDSKELLKYFIVVDWDQRGAGKSFNDSISPNTMNIKQFLSDTHDLIQILRKRFKKEKIFLIGHSWGSVLGLYTAYNHPELLYAYVGMGQVIHSIEGEILSYEYTLKKAKDANDSTALKTLKAIGMPPYLTGFRAVYQQRELLGKYGGAMRNISYPRLNTIREAAMCYTEANNAIYMRAFAFSASSLWGEVMDINFLNEIQELKVPVYFFTGRNDYQTPFKLIEIFYNSIEAPHKELIWFEKSAHMPNLEEPTTYQDQLKNILLKTIK